MLGILRTSTHKHKSLICLCHSFRSNVVLASSHSQSSSVGSDIDTCPLHLVFVQFFFAISGAGNSTSLVLVLTELTGLYAISSVLLIRKQLPLKYR